MVERRLSSLGACMLLTMAGHVVRAWEPGAHIIEKGWNVSYRSVGGR